MKPLSEIAVDLEGVLLNMRRRILAAYPDVSTNSARDQLDKVMEDLTTTIQFTQILKDGDYDND